MLKQFIKDIEKSYVKNNDQIVFDPARKYKAYSSGSMVVDEVSSTGGLAVRGRIVEVFGPEGCGKTTLSLQTCAAVQKAGDVGVFMDYEHTYDYLYGKALGISYDMDTFVTLQPKCGEEGEEILDKLFDKFGSSISLIVVDSIAACKPQALFDVKPEDAQKAIGYHASYWSRFISKLNNYALKCNTAILLTNQIRNKITTRDTKYSVMNTGMGAGFNFADSSVTTTGGQAIRHYMSARFLLVQSSPVKEMREDAVTGEMVETKVATWTSIKNVKNKMGYPFRTGKFVIKYGVGTDDIMPLFDLGLAKGFIVKTNSWYAYKSTDGSLNFKENGQEKFVSHFSKPEIQADFRKQQGDVVTSMDDEEADTISKNFGDESVDEVVEV